MTIKLCIINTFIIAINIWTDSFGYHLSFIWWEIFLGKKLIFIQIQKLHSFRSKFIRQPIFALKLNAQIYSKILFQEFEFIYFGLWLNTIRSVYSDSLIFHVMNCKQNLMIWLKWSNVAIFLYSENKEET